MNFATPRSQKRRDGRQEKKAIPYSDSLAEIAHTNSFLFRLNHATKQLEESLVPVPFQFCARCGALFKLMGGRYIRA